MKNFQKNKKGFTLLELLVAMGIFSIISVAVVAAFANVMIINQKTRIAQKQLEEAGTAMETMAKIIRMSDNVNADSNNIYIRNTSQEKCIRYYFNNASGVETLYVNEFSYSDPTECANTSNINYNDLASVDFLHGVTGSFDVTLSDDVTNGKATILMHIGDKDLQTTVSFLDYQ